MDYLLQVKTGAFSVQVQAIRGIENKKDRVKQKSFLPCVRYQQMNPGGTADAAINEFTGIVYLDFDEAEILAARTNPDLLISELTQHSCVIAAFRSCSGRGVSCLIEVEGITDETCYKHAFNELCEIFSQYCEADPAACNPSRAHFVSFDSKIYIAKNPQPFVTSFTKAVRENELAAAESEKQKQFQQMQGIVNKVHRAHNPTDEDYFHQLLEYCQKVNVSVTESYSDWLRMGFAIAKVFGHDDRALEMFHAFSALSPGKYQPFETEQKFSHICKTTENKVSVNAVLRDAQKVGFRYDYETHKAGRRKLELSEYETVLRNIRIGVPLSTTVAEFHQQEKQETVMWLYEKYAWLYNAYREKVNEKTGEVTLRMVKLPMEVATVYVHQHHKPRWSVVNGYEILVNGSYEICKTSHENMIQYYLATKGIAFGDVHKAIYQEGKFTTYEPLKDYFDTITTIFTREQAAINANAFIEVLRKHNRIDFEKISFDDMFMGIVVWGVYAVAQAFCDGSRVNDTLLGFVSITQGTGKTQFVNAMKRPFERINMAGDAREAYNLDRDGKRKMMKNFILFDDEDVGRNKQEVENIKKCLSMQYIEFVEKYDKQDTRGKRISSYVFSSNNPNFLKENSRRELIISFAENVDFNPLAYHNDLSNDTLVNGFWAFCWYEAMHNMPYYEIKAQEIQKMKVIKNKTHMQQSIERELIEECFTLPDSIEGGPTSGNYHALRLVEVKIYLEACYEKLHGGMTNSTEVSGTYQKAGAVVQEHKIRAAMQSLGFHTKDVKIEKRVQKCYCVLLKPINQEFYEYIKGRMVDNPRISKILGANGEIFQTKDPESENYIPL
jgi:hypothetical protein